MRLAGYVGHFERPSPEFIAKSRLEFGLLELVERHPPAVVGRADLQLRRAAHDVLVSGDTARASAAVPSSPALSHRSNAGPQRRTMAKLSARVRTQMRAV